MAWKGFSLVSLIALLLLFSPSSDAASPQVHDKRPSPFDLLKNVEGAKKGDKIEGINNVKKYLDRFGYLSYSNSIGPTDANEDAFDDSLESAIKTYQINYRLNVTGTLDAETVSTMIMPRCGVADISNGTNWMARSGNGSTQAHPFYAYFSGNPKWPAEKYHLTYGFDPSAPVESFLPVYQAFQAWASNSQFTFSRVDDESEADLKIGFYNGDHGDGSPFDGPLGTLAHAFSPIDGRLHLDGAETWNVGAAPNTFDVGTVVLHEIGHLLGLAHSPLEEAIMYARIPPGTTKSLNADDIDGIKALYNV